MLRTLPIINEKKQRRKIGIHPSSVVMIEEISRGKCYVVVRIQHKEFTYVVPKPYKYLENFVNLSPYGLFMEN